MKFVGVKNEAGDFATQSDVGSVYTNPTELVGSSDGHLWYDTDEDFTDFWNWGQVVPWSPVAAYQAEGPVSVVTYQGSTYVAIQPSVNVIPSSDPTKWQLVAARGSDGTNGTNGLNGQDSTAKVALTEPPASSFPNSIIPEGAIWIDPDAGNVARQEIYARNAQKVMGGGQARKIVSTSGIAWSVSPNCLDIYGAGRGPTTSPDGYFRIFMPPNGTVIQVLGRPTAGPHTVTVTGGYIPLLAGETLWWAIPLGSAWNAAGTFYITAAGSGGAGANYEVPETWLRIITRAGGYPVDPSAYRWGDGMHQSYWTGITFLNGWTNYGPTSFSTAAWKKTNGLVTWRGLIAGGTAGSAICSLDPLTNGNNNSGYADLFTIHAGGVDGRLDATPTALVATAGANSYYQLAGLSYWNTPDT